MRLIECDGVFYEVLCKMIYPQELTPSDISLHEEYIVIKDNTIIYLRKIGWSNSFRFVNIDELDIIIDNNISTTYWRSANLKEIKINYLNDIRSNMMRYQRDLIISDILDDKDIYLI